MKKVLASFLIFLMLLSAMPIAVAADTSFADVAAGAYYYDAVLWAVEKEITLGIRPGIFDPKGGCTRAQAVTFLWRAAGSPLPVDSSNPFADVASGSYYHTAVLWAVEQGITNGVTSETFGPKLQCTRAQIATFLYRLAGSPTVEAVNPFSDAVAGAFYYNAVLWAAEKGVTNGLTATTFGPGTNCTRGQIVTFLHRGKDLIEKVLIPEGAWSFCNEYAGYKLMVGPEFTADLSLGCVAAQLHSEDTVIEIYKQSLSTISAQYYTNNLYAFLDNTVDHTTILRETRTYAERTVKVTSWYRNALAKVSADKNYYLYFDVMETDAIYSVYIKSSRADLNPEQYAYLVQTLELFAPTAQAPAFHGAPVQKQWSEETTLFYETYYGSAAGQTWGIMEPYAAARGDFSIVNEYEDALNYEFPILSTYTGFEKDSLEKLDLRLWRSWESGKVLQLSIQPNPTKSGNVMYEILQGTWDNVLDVYIQKIKAFGHPVMIRLMNEMNGDWCVYSGGNYSNDTLIFKEAYRYIYHRFEDAGVNNVLWIWNPNGKSYPPVDWNHTLMYYPGDEYVDIVGLTAFNTGTYYASVGETWQDFTTLYEQLYAQYCEWFAHPLMFTGFSCAELGGDKRAWTEDMFQKIGQYDRAKVLVWWDSVDYDLRDPKNPVIARDYRIRGENVDIFDLFIKYIGVPEPEEPTPDPEEPIPDPEEPIPDPEEPIPDPEQPTPDPEQPTPDPEQPTPDPEQPTPDPEQPTPDPEQPTPDPTEPTPAD